MHTELVEQPALDQRAPFLHALNYCMVLPGPEAQQLATYIGWLMHRTWGGIVAGGLFVLPSLFILDRAVVDLPALRRRAHRRRRVHGIKPAVTALVLHAAHRISTRALKNALDVGHRCCCIRRDLCVRHPVPGIVAAAALIRSHFGARRSRPRVRDGWCATAAARGRLRTRALIDDKRPRQCTPCFSRNHLAKVACCQRVALWALAMAALMRLQGWQGTLAQMGWFFTKAAAADFSAVRMRCCPICTKAPSNTTVAERRADDRRPRAWARPRPAR